MAQYIRTQREHSLKLACVSRNLFGGLHYLHALCQPKIIHRDIKASNTLLEKNLSKYSRFGLALLFRNEESHIMTMHVVGTRGYLALQYATLGQLSEKVDVYRLGDCPKTTSPWIL